MTVLPDGAECPGTVMPPDAVSTPAPNVPTTDLQFNPETHTYLVNGVAVPSVTQILKSAGLIDDYGFSEHSAWHGSRIHLACRFDDEGDLLESEFTEEELGFLEGWRLCKSELGFTILEIEQPHFCETGWYCGTPDRLIRLPGDNDDAVMDLKSGVYQPWHRLQLAAYTNFYPGVYRRIAIYLKPGKAYTAVEFPITERRRDLNTFLTVAAGQLAAHRWKELGR